MSKFIRGSQYTHISTINMYKFIKIRHDIIKQCHENKKKMEKFNYKLVLRGAFSGFGCPKRHPDAPLAKTMLGRLMALIIYWTSSYLEFNGQKIFYECNSMPIL